MPEKGFVPLTGCVVRAYTFWQNYFFEQLPESIQTRISIVTVDQVLSRRNRFPDAEISSGE